MKNEKELQKVVALLQKISANNPEEDLKKIYEAKEEIDKLPDSIMKSMTIQGVLMLEKSLNLAVEIRRDMENLLLGQ